MKKDLVKDPVVENQLWDEYDRVKDLPDKHPSFIQARNALMEYHLDILEGISRRMSYRLKEITEAEIASYGVDGLIDAIDSYDRAKDIKFKTWATFRIRGSIIDHIRQADWVPRLVRQRHTKFEAVKNKIESAKGKASDIDMATELGLSEEEYSELVKKSLPVTHVSMNSKPRGSDNDHDELGDMVSRADTTPIDDGLLREEMYKKLMGRNFTKPERRIVYLHYYEDLTMKEIAEKTGFSESRISQMHADILRRLQKRIECNPSYAEDLQKMLESR